MCFETFIWITTAKYRALFHVLLLSAAFLLLLTALDTFINSHKYILKAVVKDDPSYEGSPLIASGVFFGIFAVFVWIAPSVISLIGLRVSMIVGSFAYSFSLIQILYPTTWLLYTTAVILGLGSTILWTAQGHYLTINSTQYTIVQHSGIFWALMQICMLLGNLYMYFRVNSEIIEKDQRLSLLIVLLVVSLLGTSFLLTLGKPVFPLSRKLPPLQILISTMKLFITKDMLLLCLTFMHTGINFALYTGIYSNALGNTLQLDTYSETSKISSSGMLIATGNVFGGAIFGFCGPKTAQMGRYPIVFLGFIFHLIAAILIFINLPNAAAFQPTHEDAIIKSNIILAFTCSFMLGFGDACYNTQIFGVLGSVFADKSCEGFALYRSVQSVFSGITFCATKIGFYGLLPIFMVSALLGAIGFFIIEMRPTYQTVDSTNQEAANMN